MHLPSTVNIYMGIDEALYDVRKDNSNQCYTTQLYPICYKSGKEALNNYVERRLETIFCRA